MRERLPDRRQGWTQKAKIEGQTFYLIAGEYPDGRLGEIFLEAHKEGTFVRGVLSALARMMSIALQSGVGVGEVVKTLRGLNFAPRGYVIGSAAVRKCDSVMDWIAREIEARYIVMTPDESVNGKPENPAPETTPFDGTYAGTTTTAGAGEQGAGA